MLTAPILLSCAAVAAASPILSSRQAATAELSVADASWDRQCFYPQPDDDFDLEDYLGTWYQVAGTPAPFTSGCTCVTANYALNDNGTANVVNTCQAQGQLIDIVGTATPVNEAYGDDGVFSVQFPGQPPPECPGPNYIVQSFEEGDADDYNEENGWAIVQASNFTTLFLLSRTRSPAQSAIDRWIRRAGRLGTNVTEVELFDQTNCLE